MKKQTKPKIWITWDKLIANIKELSKNIPEHREMPEISLSDAIMSWFALFSLKCPSLLSFDTRIKDNPNMKNIFHITKVPSDTAMRQILDELNPIYLRKMYTNIFSELQKNKWLQSMQFYNGSYLLSWDWTWYFSSKKVHCKDCMEKVNKKTWEVEYYHQFYWASIVHPDSKEVISLCPEPIQKQDWNNKNDSKRNASKRFFEQFRKEHPKLKVIVIEDALSSNAPHIEELKKHNISYILWVKKWDHKYLFETVNWEKVNLKYYEYLEEYTTKWWVTKETIHKFKYT